MDIELLLSDWERIMDESPDAEERDDSSDDELDGSSMPRDPEVAAEEEDAISEEAASAGRAYLENVKGNGGITLVQEAKVVRAYQTKGMLGLFALFFSRSVRNTQLQWLNPRLSEKGIPVVTLRELNAYIGLEIATSLCSLNRLRDYWSTNELYGHQLFRTTMQRDLFLGIRSALTLHPVDTVPEEVKVRDPLWHCRSILNNILKKCANFAVPNGVSALDESSIRIKARSAARTYIPSKPDKYTVRFYALVDWKTLYVHGLFDNGSGNTTVAGHLERYTAIFPELRRVMTTRCDQGGLDPKSATALWVAMLSLQNQQLLSPSGKRLVVMDSYYTRHAFAKHVHELTLGEMRVIGTCRINYVDSFSRPAVESVIRELNDAERGCWKLVAAHDLVDNVKELEKTHKQNQKGLRKAQKTPFEPPYVRSPHAGYIVFRDKRVVVFYTNGLAATPSADVLDGNTAEAQTCCHGMGFVQRWPGQEMFRRTAIRAPVQVCAYNVFMNAVDRFDQMRSTNPTRRRERRLNMSIFTWLLDVAIHNAFAMYQVIEHGDGEIKSIRAAKEGIVNRLVAAQQQHMQSLRRRATHREPIEDIIGSDSSQHMLTRSRSKLLCRLCALRGGTNRVKYACTRCRLGYHVECFMAMNYKHVMTENTAVMEALDAVIRTTSGMPKINTRQRQNSSIIDPDEIELPRLFLRELSPRQQKRARILPAS